MNPKNPAPSRAGEVWKRLIGCFGGDAVERKYGETIPPEWEAMMGTLREFEIERGLRRLVYSGKSHVPALPEFVKLCRIIAHDDFDEPSSAPALPNPDNGKFDEWDIAANRHLWNYVFAQMRTRQFDERETRILVGFKHAWARDMREGLLDRETGEVKPPEVGQQKAEWEDCMQRAMAAIADLKFKQAA